MESNNNSEIIAATKILLSISNADGKIDKNEKNIINIILHDFFEISIDKANKIMIDTFIEFKKSSEIYDDSKILNKAFSYEDKIDFICCCFEVALSDENLHYLEFQATIFQLVPLTKISVLTLLVFQGYSEPQNHLDHIPLGLAGEIHSHHVAAHNSIF